MGYRYGFKTEANALANDVRAELGLRSMDPLDPRELANHLEIPIWDVSSFTSEGSAILALLNGERASFSAATVFAGHRRTIVHNDSHAQVRQHSNLAHELAHSLLQHPPTPALDDQGCRDWNQDVEDEAEWLAGVLLIPEDATLSIVRLGWSKEDAAAHFGVSVSMVQRRLNATGAVKRVNRARSARG
ncbi:ImmA/IrrE family metallo-endopeptidase [Demequina sp.]|uniref:ImmA/IrrE family metallo-endopeptidase n=1 Tax=Demequina sp. TaxID=2050685 RepID=UPI003D0F0120